MSSNLSGKIFEKIGPFFRSEKIIKSNLKIAFPEKNPEEFNKIITSMWNNYGRFWDLTNKILEKKNYLRKLK